MFKKKCTSKESQTVGKGDVKKLRADVVSVIGKDNADKFDLVVGKKDTITKRKYRCGPGSSVFVYSVDEVPFFISIDRLGKEEQDVITQADSFRFLMIPTVFFFLRLHQLLAERGDEWASLVNEGVVATVCRGSTSRFLLRGAHLMMPGILSTRKKTPLVVGDVALIYSLGVDVPYAVGIVTSNMTAKQDAGVGVFVVQCFHDNLWQEFENRFITNCSLSSQLPLIPSEFGEDEVRERLLEVGSATKDNEKTDDEVSSNEAAEWKETPGVDYANVFSDEDTMLNFCLCEAVKRVSPSLLPMPVTQFTSIVVASYPRDGAHTSAIQFKDTKYKKALAFFHGFPDLLTIAETSPGTHSVTQINKSADVMRQHNALYVDFLSTMHRERCEKEAQALQAKLLAEGTGVFRQYIVSADVFYAAPRGLEDDLIRILLIGEGLNIPRDALFPTIEQVATGTVPVFPRTPIGDSVLQELYTRKTLVNNLKNYIKAHNLLIVNEAEKCKLPSVKIDDTLSMMLTSKAYAPEIPLDQVVQGMLSLFKLKHEIILQTVVEGSSLASGNLNPKRIIKNGPLPKVRLWSEKSTNNKFITVVQSLESFGFDLQMLADQWKKQFCTSSGVVDPSTKMKNLKSGTKIPLEIHLQGNFQVQVAAALLNEANFPSSQLVCKKR
ncbi:Translation initiation factor SUI1 [Leishmania donovani]|uniref:Translation_initiation_factor_SUI1_putative/Pfam: PF01253 n=2 Tax=Leishmania donovani TaxID=5661 RepID=A0A6J8FAD0_LEIDO|nr:Translation initiation factor SUI1 [Leishmania donovani]VDZ44658.1 Translation_initiation_factor_SUI1_putative/Pfam:PF01253 [Leishmania donovani]